LADIFLICSKKENYPTTCLEAQACGAVVFGFNNGGIKETTNYTSNHFVDDEDIDELAKMIINQNVLDDTQRQKNAENARDRISMNASMRKYMDLYNDMLKLL